MRQLPYMRTPRVDVTYYVIKQSMDVTKVRILSRQERWLISQPSLHRGLESGIVKGEALPKASQDHPRTAHYCLLRGHPRLQPVNSPSHELIQQLMNKSCSNKQCLYDLRIQKRLVSVLNETIPLTIYIWYVIIENVT